MRQLSTEILCDAAEGTNATALTEYTQGVSKVGTAGTSGAYTSISIDENTAISLCLRRWISCR